MKNLITLLTFVLAVNSCSLWAGRRTPTIWTQEESAELMSITAGKNIKDWGEVAERLNKACGKNRTARECRDMVRSHANKNFTQEDDELILSKVNEIGEKWDIIAQFLKNKDAISVKARYEILSRKKNIIERANGVCKYHQWTQVERDALKEIVESNQGSTWEKVTEIFNSRFNLQVSIEACKGYARMLGVGLNKNHQWTQVERDALKEIVESNQGSTWEKVTEIFNSRFNLQMSIEACIGYARRLGLRLNSAHKWTQEDGDALKEIVESNKGSTWESVAGIFNSKFGLQVSVKACSDYAGSLGLRLGSKYRWTQEECDALMNLAAGKNIKDWAEVAVALNNSYGNNRTAKACRDRVRAYANKDFTKEEDGLILSKVNELGEKWSVIAKFLDNKDAASVKARYRMLSRSKKIDNSSGADRDVGNQNVVVPAFEKDDFPRLQFDDFGVEAQQKYEEADVVMDDFWLYDYDFEAI